ncbi:MAG: hypothetical protein K2Y37_14785 [Pirellulales bacterium]|nr:hypothetical protein [Pirellulales bacterium]
MTPLPTTGAGSANAAGVPPFAPGDLSGLTLYLDAHDLATLWQTNDTSQPVTTLGDAVGRWLDKSANAYVLSQATAGERATWRNDQTGANGRGTFVTPSGFGAGSKWLGSTIAYSSLYTAGAFTSYIVGRSVSPAATQCLIADDAGLFFHRWAGATSLTARAWNGTLGQSEVVQASIAGSTPYIFQTRRDTTPNLLISANGGTETSTASAGNVSFGTAKLTIPTAQAGSKHDGWLGHVLIYSRSLTASERNQVGQWLASLYGLTWTDQ